MAQRSGWLRGTIIRKSGASTATSTRTSTPSQVQSTSATIYGGGVKDPSGRTSEYFVRICVPLGMYLQLTPVPCSPWMTNVQSASRTGTSTRNYGCWSARVTTKCEPNISFESRRVASYRGYRCESCIDRLFTLGPAPCPICNKILRKLAFTPQTFEDLTVEKEVAVRRRIAKE